LTFCSAIQKELFLELLAQIENKTNEVANQMATSLISIPLIDYSPTNVS